MRSKKIAVDGANVVLTGATRGIGRALCARLIAQGATIAAIARDENNLLSLRKELGEQVVPFPCDLAHPNCRRETIGGIIERFGRLDGLINNAAVQKEVSLVDGDPDERTAQLACEVEINLSAPIHLISELGPLMHGSSAPFVINVTSGLAIAPKEAAPVYSATKAGLRSFTKAFRYQAQSDWPALHVIEVIMALVDTDMTQGRGNGKISPERAAAEILDGLLARRDEVWVAKAKLLPWLQRVSPRIPERILR